jgi:hypothetical protein
MVNFKHITSRILFLLFAALFLATPVYAQNKSGTTDVKAALKSVGMLALPEFLDAATESITLKFPKILGGGTLKFGGNIDADALTQKKFIFETSDGHGVTWNNAFGMLFLDMTDVGLNLTIEKGAFTISLDGMLGGAFKKSGKAKEVVIDLAVTNKKLTDFTLSLPDTKLSLHSVPELKSIPGSTKFAIEAPTISMNAIGGKVDFLNEVTDAVVFYDEGKKGWNIGLQFEKALTLADLTGHKNSFLKNVGLPKMKLIASTKGLSEDYSSLPLAVQNFYKSTGDLPSGKLDLAQGVNIVAEFDANVAPADVKKALGSLGLGAAVLEIDGTVEGMFGGTPSVELAVQIDAPKGNAFKFLKLKDTHAEFFMKLSKTEAALGFRTAIELKHKKDVLEFDIDFELVEQEGAVEVQAAGGMKGDWHNAAGIKGLTLENPFLSVGINETVSFDMLIDGTILIGSEKIRAAADMVLSPEAAGLPTAFAFAGEINKLPFNVLAEHAKKHAKQKGGGFKAVKAELRDVAFAYMTPGSKLPADLEDELHIEGSGMALKAALYVNNKELGAANGYASTDGLSITGKIDPFHLGPLDLKDAELAIQAGPSVESKFAMSGDIVLFKGFEEKYELDLEPQKFKFLSDTKFGGAFEAVIEAESNGLNFASSNDFAFEAELAANYSKVFRNLVQGALKGLKKGDKDLKNAENSVKKTEKKISGLNRNIKSEKAKAKKAYENAVNKINGAKHKVDKLKKTISYNKKKAHNLGRKAKHDAKHFKFGKAAKEGTELAGVKSAIVAEEAALKTADWALKTAKKTVKVVPVDAAPKVIALNAELKTAQAGLKVAEGVLKAAQGVNKGVEAAVKAIGNGLTALKINKLGAAGSLKGITSGGKQGKIPVLIIDVTIHGKHHVYRENLSSLEKGFEHLASELAKEVANEVLKVFKKG